MEKIDKDFIEQLIDLVEYWSVQKKDKDCKLTNEEYILNGFTFSLLIMFNGCNSVNNFTPLRVFQGENEIGQQKGLQYEFYKQLEKRKNKNTILAKGF